MNPEKSSKNPNPNPVSLCVLFSTLIIIIRNDSWAANQHIRIISEGSCDTEDWSNDAESFVEYFKLYSSRKQLF